MQSVAFYSEDIEFDLSKKQETTRWIINAINDYTIKFSDLSIIFCSDEHLLKINQEYLNHDYYTDIITFDHSDQENQIEGDIFVSIERIKENSTLNNVSFESELHRVIIHGVLHLLGFNDKTSKEKAQMRNLENHYLALRF